MLLKHSLALLSASTLLFSTVVLGAPTSHAPSNSNSLQKRGWSFFGWNSPVFCLGPTYLPPGGSSCVACPDANALTCNTNGQSTLCLTGVPNNGVCPCNSWCPDQKACACDLFGASTACKAGTVQNGRCKNTVCPSSPPSYLSSDGSRCVPCNANVTQCTASAAQACSYGVVVGQNCLQIDCSAKPSYVSAAGNQCIPCNANVTQCNAAAAQSCSYGVVVGQNCLQIDCSRTPTPSYVSSLGNQCIPCNANVTQCNAAAAQSCSYGVVVGHSCLQIDCSAQPSYVSAGGNTCIPCSKYGKTCDSTGDLSCLYGTVNSSKICSPVDCSKAPQPSFLNATSGSSCIPCGPGASACDANGKATACSRGTLNTKLGTCDITSCPGATYPSSDGTGCLNCKTNVTQCVATAAQACSYGVVVGQNCLQIDCSAQPSYVSPLGNTCIPCSKYGKTCDSTGDLTCLYGIVNSSKICSPVDCTKAPQPSYLNAKNGNKCIPCGPGASACDANGKATACSQGTLNKKLGTCDLASCPNATYLSSDGTGCLNCNANVTQCVATAAQACSYGVVVGQNCLQIDCSAQPSYVSPLGNACIPCSKFGKTCDSTGDLTCTYGRVIAGVCTAQTCSGSSTLSNDGSTCIAPDCSKTTSPSYLNVQSQTCVNCGVNATVCDGTGSTKCNFGSVSTPSGGGPASCVAASCPSTPTAAQALNVNGTGCVSCGANATSCDYLNAFTCAYGNVVSGVCTPSTCTGATYLNALGTNCPNCPDARASSCQDVTGASTACSYGTLTSTSANCAAVTCIGDTYLNFDGKSCNNCTDPNGATCDQSDKSTSCLYGNLDTTAGKCLPAVCTGATYLGLNGTTCIGCEKNATTCAATGSITCSFGIPSTPSDGTPAVCTAASCPSTLTLPQALAQDGKTCVGCGTNATSCDYLKAFSCSYGSVSDQGVCTSATCSGKTYLDGDGTKCPACPDTNAAACADVSGASTGCVYGNLDASLGRCVAATCTGASYLSADGTNCINCGTNATACDAAGASTCSFGSVLTPSGGGPASCVAASCPSTPTAAQALNVNGTGCVSCGANATSCDYLNAFTCAYGNVVSGVCTPSTCTGATYLNALGTNCPNCPDARASSCQDVTGASTACSYGTLTSTSANCAAVTCIGDTYLNFDGKSCNNCTDPNGATCDQSDKSTSCLYGNLDTTAGKCLPAVCTGATYLGLNGTTCIGCEKNATTCAATGSITCSFGIPSTPSDGTPAVCTAASCPSTLTLPQALAQDGKTCVGCGTNATSCDYLKAFSCSYGSVSDQGVCTSATCSGKTYLDGDGTKCPACPDTNAAACADVSGASTGCVYGNLDASLGRCVAATCTGASYLSADGTNCINCGTNATACDAAGASTCSFGSVLTPSGGGPASCVAASCPSTPTTAQALNVNGTGCVSCGANATSCDYLNAFTCAYGNVVSGVCTPSTCTGATYLNALGTNCPNCPDTNATACQDVTGISTTCKYGILTPAALKCTAVTCAGDTYLNFDGKSCNNCTDPNGATCDQNDKSTSCLYGNLDKVLGRCVGATCTGASYVSVDGTSCINCGVNATLCDATGSTQCTFGKPTAVTPGGLLSCNAVSCPSTATTPQALNINGTGCVSCGTNATSCNYVTATTCRYGNVVSGVCTPAACSGKTYLNSDGTSCPACPDPYATGCSAISGASTGCSYGNLDTTLGRCVSARCTGAATPSSDGTSCVSPDCSKTSTPSFLNSITQLCVNCGVNATSCASSGALTCAFGTATVPSGGGQAICAAVSCPSTSALPQALNVNGTGCVPCGKYATSCDYSGALSCSYGNLISGICTAQTCLGSSTLSSDGTTCISPTCASTAFLNTTSQTCVNCGVNATACSPSGSTQCSFGNPSTPAPGVLATCVAASCPSTPTTPQALSKDGKSCIACGTYAATCNYVNITSCAYGNLNSQGICRPVLNYQCSNNLASVDAKTCCTGVGTTSCASPTNPLTCYSPGGYSLVNTTTTTSAAPTATCNQTMAISNYGPHWSIVQTTLTRAPASAAAAPSGLLTIEECVRFAFKYFNVYGGLGLQPLTSPGRASGMRWTPTFSQLSNGQFLPTNCYVGDLTNAATLTGTIAYSDPYGSLTNNTMLVLGPCAVTSQSNPGAYAPSLCQEQPYFVPVR